MKHTRRDTHKEGGTGMTIKAIIKEIEQALETLDVIGIEEAEDRQWLENIEHKVDRLRDYSRLSDRVSTYDEKIQIIWNRHDRIEEMDY